MAKDPNKKPIKREKLQRERFDDNNTPTEIRQKQNANLVRKGLGRPVGSVNHMSRQAREALWKSIDEFEYGGEKGMIAYFKDLADNYRALHVQLVAKAFFPVQVKADIDPNSTLSKLLEAARARLQYERAKTITVPSTAVSKLGG